MKKNIMFIVPNMVGGGAEKTVGNLSIELSKFYKIYLVIIESPSEHFYDFSGKLVSLKDEIKKRYSKFDFLLKIPFIKRIMKLFFRVHLLKKMKKEYKIHASISFLFPADIINVLSKIQEKTIISLRNYTSLGEPGFIKKYAVKFNLTKCDQIIAISEGVKKDAISTYGIKAGKFKVIYNPCVMHEFNSTNNNYVEITGKYNVLNVGRLSDCKGQWHLIRAFSEVVKQLPDAKLYILGVGPFAEYLETLVDDYNLQKNIYLVGFVGNPKYYYDHCNLFAFSSIHEGLGNAVVEAIHCELPVISTDYLAGATELLSPDLQNKEINEITYGKYGVIVPKMDGIKYKSKDPLTRSEKILADGMIKILKDENMQIYYKEKLKERRKDFTVEKIVDEWKSIIEH